MTPVDHDEAESVVRRRRRVVAGVSVLGAGLLGAGLSTRPGSREFYGATLTVAGVWTAGGLLSGPLHLGWIQSRDEALRRPVVTPVATGVAAFGFFYGCALVARRVPVLDQAISRVLVFAEQGDEPLVLLTTLANGLGEEVFFRGALYAALGDAHPVVKSTAVYALATSTTRNPALVLAAGVMGVAGAPGPRPHPPDLVRADGAVPTPVVPPRPRRRAPLILSTTTAASATASAVGGGRPSGGA